MGKALYDHASYDSSRYDVYDTRWDQLVVALTRLGASWDATRRAYSLGDRHATTGWRTVTYTPSTIELTVATPRSTRILAAAGTYVRNDALGLSADLVKVHDQIKTADGKYWEVMAVREFWNGDSFYYRESDLTFLPFYTEE